MKRNREFSGPKIQIKKILEASNGYAGLIAVYRERVLSQTTRTIRLRGRKNPAKIIHTLLGYEVQASYKRIQCPDLVTARYLRLFSELGCHSIKLPYDPTLTEILIPGFEATIDSIKGKIRDLFPSDFPTQQHVTCEVFALIRRELAAP
jgi:hypothetical protein